MSTPIRRQYLEIKRRFPQAIVFFRLGDFYETFDDDAVLVARELEITLTSKPMGKDLRVPLAGVPYHSLQTHLKRLVSRGFKVAICEQLEDPKQAKGLVDRGVVRVVTPGTLVEDDLLTPAANNYLAAVSPGTTGLYGLSYVDISTGEFAAAELSLVDLSAELARLNAAELLLPAEVEVPIERSGKQTAVDRRLFETEGAADRLREHFGVASLEAYGLRGTPLATAAAGVIIAYLFDNQRTALASIRDLRVYNPSRFLMLDATARRHLEVYQTLRDGAKQGTLVETLDTTRTPMGARLLRRWLSQPLLDITEINSRLDAVQALYRETMARSQLRGLLRAMPDIERITTRLVAATAAPRELAALRLGLAGLPALQQAIPREMALNAGLGSLAGVAAEAHALLEAAIADEPEPALGTGGVIRAGYSPKLDEARSLTHDVRAALAALETEERERTGIRSLRLAYNKVFGYYIEVSNANLSLVPPDFQRRQTLVGAERFVTPRLQELEARILQARESIEETEGNLYRQVCGQLATYADHLRLLAVMLAEADVYAALAEVAVRNAYVRPDVDESECLEIRDGRHPVVEKNLAEGRFVPNDTLLDSNDAQIIVLTGPNMAGKSTYLRQVALITLMAQIGSFVPAASARIGVVDRIFTRIGAQDDLSRGESTFMVEMLETAAILRAASRRSLVLFDEVGRGTSTFDGLAIARAVVEYLHTGSAHAAKTLFATHYHEMTALALTLPRVRNFSVAVTEQDGNVVFLHRIIPGGADRSYGIHVAELAGMPTTVVARAREVLASLEADSPAPRRSTAPQLPLLASEPSEVERELAALDIDGLTPLQALTKLYEFKAKLKQKRADA